MSARHTDKHAGVWVRVEPFDDDGQGVLIVVEDEGTGVPDHLKQKIFQPFQQGIGPSSTRQARGSACP